MEIWVMPNTIWTAAVEAMEVRLEAAVSYSGVIAADHYAAQQVWGPDQLQLDRIDRLREESVRSSAERNKIAAALAVMREAMAEA